MAARRKPKKPKIKRVYAPVDFKPRPDDPAYKSEKKSAFIKAFPEFGTITPTAEAVHIDPSTVYDWIKADPSFAHAVEMADGLVTDRLHQRAVYRGLTGSDGPSASLLMFLLKCRDRRFRDRVIQEIDPKTIDFLVSSFLEAIKKNVPEFCPGCNTHLGFNEAVAKELSELSQKFVNG